MLHYSEQLTPTRIWELKQNKPSLVAKDLLDYGVPKEVTHNVLLARGVYKWLAVRRHLIWLEKIWKDRVVGTLTKLKSAKRDRNTYEIAYLRGYLSAVTQCREEVRELCHSERWQAPDFDREAQEHLESLTQQ